MALGYAASPAKAYYRNAAMLSGGYQYAPGASDPNLDCDDCARTVNLNFTFPYYGRAFNQITISSNGFILLGDHAASAEATSTNNASLAASDYGELTARAIEMIAPMWNNWDTSGPGTAALAGEGSFSGAIYHGRTCTGAGGTCLATDPYIVEWWRVEYAGAEAGDRNWTFELKLYPSGQFEFHYKNLFGTAGETCAALHNCGTTSGIAYRFKNNTVGEQVFPNNSGPVVNNAAVGKKPHHAGVVGATQTVYFRTRDDLGAYRSGVKVRFRSTSWPGGTIEEEWTGVSTTRWTAQALLDFGAASGDPDANAAVDSTIDASSTYAVTQLTPPGTSTLVSGAAGEAFFHQLTVSPQPTRRTFAVRYFPLEGTFTCENDLDATHSSMCPTGFWFPDLPDIPDMAEFVRELIASDTVHVDEWSGRSAAFDEDGLGWGDSRGLDSAYGNCVDVQGDPMCEWTSKMDWYYRAGYQTPGNRVILVVPGQDALNEDEADRYYALLNMPTSPAGGDGLFTRLRQQGYDIVIGNYADGNHRPSELDAEVFEWIRRASDDDGDGIIERKIAVVGVSQGAILVRHALAKRDPFEWGMRVDSWYSLDGPHQLANLGHHAKGFQSMAMCRKHGGRSYFQIFSRPADELKMDRAGGTCSCHDEPEDDHCSDGNGPNTDYLAAVQAAGDPDWGNDGLGGYPNPALVNSYAFISGDLNVGECSELVSGADQVLIDYEYYVAGVFFDLCSEDGDVFAGPSDCLAGSTYAKLAGDLDDENDVPGCGTIDVQGIFNPTLIPLHSAVDAPLVTSELLEYGLDVPEGYGCFAYNGCPAPPARWTAYVGNQANWPHCHVSERLACFAHEMIRDELDPGYVPIDCSGVSSDDPPDVDCATLFD